MTLGQVIRMVDGMKPNAVPDELKTQWISEVEGMVQAQVMLVLPSQIVEYQWPTDQDKELLVGAPHSKIYWSYLAAMIDFANQEFDLYANSMQMFNAHWSEFQRWFLRMYHPADEHEEQYQNETPETIGVYWRGYFLTAYGIAVKHGFRGTEQQWLESLIGAPGKSAMMRLENGKIQWRLEDEELWQDLLDASSVEHDRITAQTAAEEAAASAQNAGSAMGEAGKSAAQAQSAMSRAETASRTASESALSATKQAQQASLSAQNAERNAQTASQAMTAAQSANAQTQTNADAAAQAAEESKKAAQSVNEGVTATAENAKRAETARSAAELSEQNANRAAQTASQDATAAAESARMAASAESHAGMAEQRAADWAQDAESASTTAGQQAQAAAASAQQAQAAERSATQIVQAAATHAGRRDNPHGVTATQVGAATSAALNAHTGNRSNPHGVTAAQIGAAPAGFGLGTTTRRVSDLVDNLDDLNVNGWFSKWSGDSVANCPCEYAIIMSLVYDSGHNLQFCFNMSSREMLRRVKSTNRWDMWEYINPSMEPGVEYLTTERYMRKPVYTKLVELGTLPGIGGGKRINHGAAANQIIRVTGASSDGHAIPYRYGPESPMIWIGATETQVVVVTANRADADYSKLTGTAQIWYTK